MPGKMARQTLDQAFGLPEVLVAVSTSRLSCNRAGKTRTLMLVWDSSGESRLSTKSNVEAGRSVRSADSALASFPMGLTKPSKARVILDQPSQHYQHCRQTQNCHCEKYHRVGRHPCQKLDHLPLLGDLGRSVGVVKAVRQRAGLAVGPRTSGLSRLKLSA